MAKYSLTKISPAKTAVLFVMLMLLITSLITSLFIIIIFAQNTLAQTSSDITPDEVRLYADAVNSGNSSNCALLSNIELKNKCMGFYGIGFDENEIKNGANQDGHVAIQGDNQIGMKIFFGIIVILAFVMMFVAISRFRHKSFKKNHQALVRHIKANLQRGQSASQIRSELIRVGWNTQIIDEALKEAFKQ